MKKAQVYLSVIAALLTLAGCNKGKIIFNPDYEVLPNPYIGIGIEKIELTDTATILDVSLYNQPGYWVAVSQDVKLSGRDTGRDYKLKFIEGLAPDIMVHVDSTGYFSARLFFEPVEDRDRSVDFIEEGINKIKGIKLFDDTSGKIKTNLSGTLNAMGASWLVLIENNEDSEVKSYIVPVRQGTFNYNIYTKEPLVYKVYIGKEIKEGRVQGHPEFWSEGGEIKLDFQDASSKNFILEGGSLTQELIDYYEKKESFEEDLYGNFPEWKQFNHLRENNLLFRPEYYTLLEKLKNAKKGSHRVQAYRKIREFASSEKIFTEEGEKANLELNNLYEKYGDSIGELMKTYFDKEYSKPSLTHLYQIFESIKKGVNLDRNLELFNIFYTDTFTDHSYYKYIKEMSDLVSPVAGNHFINMTLTDKKGEKRNLSDIIDGKFSLLIIRDSDDNDLNKKLEDLLNIYEKYRSKGFEIVEIVRRENSNNKSHKISQEEIRPWVILTDMDDGSGAWRKYRMGKDRYKTFIIDETGKIIEVNSSLNNLGSLLETSYKENLK